MTGTPPGFVGSVWRTRIDLARIDDAGALRPETIRRYDAADGHMISGAIGRFIADTGLTPPCRLALAVAGVVRGDTVPITNSRWIVTRDGLAAMLRVRPVLVNDFAAKAWALAGARGVATRPLAGHAADSTDAGMRLLIGVGDELGVAAFSRDEAGRLTVIASEAGATALPSGTLTAEAADAAIRRHGARIQADAVLSAAGLLSLYGDIRTRSGRPPRFRDGHAVARAGAVPGGDPDAVAAVGIFCRTLLLFASDLVLTYGAWDGFFLSGSLVDATAATIEAQLRARDGAPRGPHARRLGKVPAFLATFEHGRLNGAAMALAASAG